MCRALRGALGRPSWARQGHAVCSSQLARGVDTSTSRHGPLLRGLWLTKAQRKESGQVAKGNPELPLKIMELETAGVKEGQHGQLYGEG